MPTLPWKALYGRLTANKCIRNDIIRELQFCNPIETIVFIKDHQRIINTYVKCHREMHSAISNNSFVPQFTC